MVAFSVASKCCVEVVESSAATEHQLFEVSERSIFIDFSSDLIFTAFLRSISNVTFLLQALWQARWPFCN